MLEVKSDPRVTGGLIMQTSSHTGTHSNKPPIYMDTKAQNMAVGLSTHSRILKPRLLCMEILIPWDQLRKWWQTTTGKDPSTSRLRALDPVEAVLHTKTLAIARIMEVISMQCILDLMGIFKISKQPLTF
jgi:hypothetical protein